MIKINKQSKLYYAILFVFLGAFKICHATEVVAINGFQISKYLGTWYELARLPNRFEDKCVAPIIADYSIDPEDSSKVVVTNKCNTKSNVEDIAIGSASFSESSNIGKLKVAFAPKWLRIFPFVYGDYWVISVDYNKIAVVGSPDHDYLWILSRKESVSNEDLEQAVNVARDAGFDVSRLIYNNSK